MSRPPARIERTVLRPTRKSNPRRASQHLVFIRQLPCISCGSVPSEPAHIRKGKDGGTGMKSSDRYSVPLCASCHRLDGRSQHSLGELTFWSELRIDPTDIALRLWTVSGNIEAGNRIVFRARQAIALRQ